MNKKKFLTGLGKNKENLSNATIHHLQQKIHSLEQIDSNISKVKKKSSDLIQKLNQNIYSKFHHQEHYPIKYSYISQENNQKSFAKNKLKNNRFNDLQEYTFKKHSKSFYKNQNSFPQIQRNRRCNTNQHQKQLKIRSKSEMTQNFFTNHPKQLKKGQIYYQNQTKYVGMISLYPKPTRQQYGQLFYKDFLIYEGEFKQNLFHGNGVQYHYHLRNLQFNQIQINQLWKEVAYQGEIGVAHKMWQKFQGQFSRGEWKQGRIYYLNGLYQGTIKNKLPWGQGVLQTSEYRLQGRWDKGSLYI